MGRDLLDKILGLKDITGGKKAEEQFEDMMKQEFSEMIESVRNYKGFYIGRYETGDLQEADSTPVVQAGNERINNVNWYWMYKNSKKIAKTATGTTSTMIWGCQWDAVMNWFFSCGGRTATYATDARSRWKKNMTPTGDNNNCRVNNIYDLAGGVWEWTMTGSPSYGYRDYRGQDINVGAADRGTAEPWCKATSYGTRCALFM